jgi:hypothetical protein
VNPPPQLGTVNTLARLSPLVLSGTPPRTIHLRFRPEHRFQR